MRRDSNFLASRTNNIYLIKKNWEIPSNWHPRPGLHGKLPQKRLGLKHTATPASGTYLKLNELSPAAVMLLHFYSLPVATS